MNTTSNTQTITARFVSGRDDYGRSTQTLIPTDGGRALGGIATIPTRTRHLVGHSHISNDWTKGPQEGLGQHQSLAEAKAALLASTGARLA